MLTEYVLYNINCLLYRLFPLILQRKTNTKPNMSQVDLKREYSYFMGHHEELSKICLDKFFDNQGPIR